MSDPSPKTGPFVCITVCRVPVYLHWTLPALGAGLGTLPAMYDSGTSGLLAFFVIVISVIGLVLIHELGHAVAALAASSEVHAIVLSGYGGFCLATMPVRVWQKALYLSGGIIAQALALGVAVSLLLVFGAPSGIELTCLTFVFVGVNTLYLIASIVPHAGSDGAQLLGLLRESR